MEFQQLNFVESSRTYHQCLDHLKLTHERIDQWVNDEKVNLKNSQHETDVEIASTAALKKRSLEVFDRTFLITDLLRVIAIVVALIGIIGALLAQQLERSREYATYRAIGFSQMQLVTVIATQTCIIGTVAAAVALPAGLSVAIILIEVINPRSFGWTMSLSIPVGIVVQTLCLAFAAAVIAGLLPAIKIMRVSPAAALRYE